MNRRTRIALLLVVFLAGFLGACTRNCPECGSLRGGVDEMEAVAPLRLNFQLCVSQIPEPVDDEQGCGDVDVQYAFVLK